MTTYKLFRVRNDRLYPLYVETGREMPLNVWLDAHIGPMADSNHVCSRLGPLSLRPGFHSTLIPFTDWIGKKQGGRLVQSPDTVWCECEIQGKQLIVTDSRGLKTLPEGWYFFKTNPKQIYPWVISDKIFIHRVLCHEEVEAICRGYGLEAQPMWEAPDTKQVTAPLLKA